MVARLAYCGLGLAAAAALALAGTARAQCRLCAEPTTQAENNAEERRLTVEIEAGLDFDRLVLLDRAGGSATLHPGGDRQVQGIEPLSARAMVGEARVTGEPGRSIRVDLPHQIALHSVSGGRITIDEIATDLPSAPRLDASGTLTFRFGGRLQVSGDLDGEFRGDVPITAEYL